MAHQQEQEKDDGTDKGTITYIYDATGNKLQKIVKENATGNVPAKTITTTYIGSFVYEHSSGGEDLQFFSHEEGRTRPVRDANNVITGYTYDYFLKDHLGNIRMVLTDEAKPTGVYQATMEEAAHAVETQLFGNITETRWDKPANNEFDADGNNQKVSRLYNLSGTDKRVGPYVVLKVMAGDKFTAKVFGWYKPGQTDATLESGVSSIVNSLVAAFTGAAPLASHTESGSQVSSSGVLNNPLGTFLSGQPAPATGVPKAYLNYMVLDEQQLKLVTGNHNSVLIPTISGTMQKQLMQAAGGMEVEVKKNGYLFVYVSNESKGSVYFDDLRVEHIRGPILEETHYYPFGLSMAGISSKAAGGVENKKKFNDGTELNTDFDINLYETNYRSLDPQLGRFWQVDPMGDFAFEQSPYSYGSNNPLTFNDPLGLFNDTTGKNPTPLPVVVVTAKAKKLEGGSYNGVLYSSIQEKSFTAYGYTSIVTKKLIPNNQLEQAFQKWIAELRTLSKVYGYGATLAGGSALDLKSLKDYKEIFKKLIKEKKITIGNPAVLAIATLMGIRSGQFENQAEAISKILSDYHIMHSSGTEQGKGIFVITESSYVGSMGPNGGTVNTSFYDVSTKKSIGSTYEHY